MKIQAGTIQGDEESTTAMQILQETSSKLSKKYKQEHFSLEYQGV